MYILVVAAASTVRLHSKEVNERQKKGSQDCYQVYEGGELVWLNNPTLSCTRLALHWRYSHLVMQVLPLGGEAELGYRIVSPLDPLARAQVVHHDRLKGYTLFLPSQTVPDSLPSVTAPSSRASGG